MSGDRRDAYVPPVEVVLRELHGVTDLLLALHGAVGNLFRLAGQDGYVDAVSDLRTAHNAVTRWGEGLRVRTSANGDSGSAGDA